jgi:putative FmdB family regulatory protein
MPVYEYACPKCGEFEVTQRITEPVLSRCPSCRSRVKKLISQTSFQLKGSGWYATDYARKNGGAGADRKGESPAQTESTSKSDAPAEKSGKKDAAKGGSAAAA